jgi:hypothetical protein
MRKWAHRHGRKIFPSKAELCLRPADGLSLNNPGRFELMDLADDFRQRAKELEAQACTTKRNRRGERLGKSHDR